MLDLYVSLTNNIPAIWDSAVEDGIMLVQNVKKVINLPVDVFFC